MKKKNCLVLILSALLLSSCGNNVPSSSFEGSDSSSTSTTIENSIEILSPLNGREIDLLYSQARSYLNSENKASYLKAATQISKGDHVTPLNLKWKVTSNSSAKYTLEIAKDAEFKDIYKTFTGLRKSVSSLPVYNLAPGKYFYRIKGDNMTSSTDSFIITDQVHTIYTNDRICNMRDLGGWKIGENKRVRYDYLYRSCNWSSVDKTSESQLKALGMRTELDIRYSSSSKSYAKSEHPIDGINYVNLGMGQYDAILPNSGKYYGTAHANFKNMFELLAKKESYPLTFHCTYGADRTGTLAFLINGLLGVSYEDLCSDFELTTFYGGSKRWRSDIDAEGNFTTSGIMQDDSSNYVAFGALYQNMMKGYGKSDGRLDNAIANYLTTVCGISSQTLTQVKMLLIEDIK